MQVDEAPATAYAGSEQTAIEPYRAVSALAVMSLVLGALSVLSLVSWFLAATLPLVGIAVGLKAFLTVRSRPRELTGLSMAKAGLALSIVFFLAGNSMFAYVFVTEVPDGYERISYARLQPDPSKPEEVIPPSAKEIDGSQVFVKGYVLPGARQTGIKQFILVPDSGTCCFGATLPKQSDMILVTLADPLEMTYSTRRRKLAGTLHVDEVKAREGTEGPIYRLEADYLQ